MPWVVSCSHFEYLWHSSDFDTGNHVIVVRKGAGIARDQVSEKMKHGWVQHPTYSARRRLHKNNECQRKLYREPISIDIGKMAWRSTNRDGLSACIINTSRLPRTCSAGAAYMCYFTECRSRCVWNGMRVFHLSVSVAFHYAIVRWSSRKGAQRCSETYSLPISYWRSSQLAKYMLCKFFSSSWYYLNASLNQ